MQGKIVRAGSLVSFGVLQRWTPRQDGIVKHVMSGVNRRLRTFIPSKPQATKSCLSFWVTPNERRFKDQSSSTLR